MIAPLLAAALLGGAPSYPDGPPPFSPALGRPLAWDRYGLYALDAEGTLPKADADILAEVRAGELGRAEVLCRNRMRADGDDVLAAWTLGQIVRARRTDEQEYRLIEERLAEPASPAVLLYRLHVCRVRFDRTMRPSVPQAEFELRQALDKQMKALCDRLRPHADAHLGIATAITQIDPFYALTNRATLESYRNSHPKGPDVRPLLCQAYNSGVGYGLATFKDGHKERLHFPDEPQPKKALEIALSILKDRPDDPFGHFYVGRGYARTGIAKGARREMQIALDAGGLPPAYELTAHQYLETGSEDAFRPKTVVY